MSPIAISGAVFVCLCGSVLLGMWIRRALPDHHLNPDSKDVMKLGMAMIATLSALVLGMMIVAAKGTFDTQTSAIRHISANVLLLDRLLVMYGPETRESRDLLRRSVAATSERLWPTTPRRSANLGPGGAARHEMEVVYDEVASLSPQNELQRSLQSQALQILADLGETRLQLFVEGTSLSLPVLAVLVLWLMILLAGYGVLAPRNATVLAVLMACTISLTGALLLMLEFDRPFDGIVRVSSAPLLAALSELGK